MTRIDNQINFLAELQQLLEEIDLYLSEYYSPKALELRSRIEDMRNN